VPWRLTHLSIPFHRPEEGGGSSDRRSSGLAAIHRSLLLAATPVVALTSRLRQTQSPALSDAAIGTRDGAPGRRPRISERDGQDSGGRTAADAVGAPVVAPWWRPRNKGDRRVRTAA
jgi:hypothetical protein